MPNLDAEFAKYVNGAVQLALAGERSRAACARAGLRNEISISHLEAMYETAFLRIFLRWEDFLEQTFYRYLCGYGSARGVCSLLVPVFKTIADAETDVLGGRDFQNWANPAKVVTRARRYMTAGFHETVINSDVVRLSHFNSVRNRIAHSSEYARAQFDAATRFLALRRFPGSSPGRFLRELAVPAPVPQSWLEIIADELRNLSQQISS